MAEEKIAKGIWLRDIYEGKSMSNWIHLSRNLYNLRMKESSSFQVHLNEINALVSKLTVLGVNMDEEERITILLCSIRGLLDGVVMSLSNTVDLNFDSAIN